MLLLDNKFTSQELSVTQKKEEGKKNGCRHKLKQILVKLKCFYNLKKRKVSHTNTLSKLVEWFSKDNSGRCVYFLHLVKKRKHCLISFSYNIFIFNPICVVYYDQVYISNFKICKYIFPSKIGRVAKYGSFHLISYIKLKL